MAYNFKPQTPTKVILKPSQFISTENAKKMLASMFANQKTRDAVVTEYLSACAANPALTECDPVTSFPAYVRGRAMGFAFGVGEYDVIPYKDNNKGYSVAQFQIGAKGFRQLALRSGVYRNVDVRSVRQGEYKGRDKYTGEPVVEFDQYEDLKKPIIGYFAYAVKYGEKEPCATDFMTKEEAVAWGKRYSRSFSKGPWQDDFDAMAKKTVIKRLCNQKLAKSVEIQQAIRLDQAVLNTDDDKPEYIDAPNEKDVNPADFLGESLEIDQSELAENPLGDAEDRF